MAVLVLFFFFPHCLFSSSFWLTLDFNTVRGEGLTVTSQMGSWKVVVLCHELNYDLVSYPPFLFLVLAGFITVKNTFALLGFEIDVMFLVLLGPLLCMINTSLEISFPCYMYTWCS